MFGMESEWLLLWMAISSQREGFDQDKRMASPNASPAVACQLVLTFEYAVIVRRWIFHFPSLSPFSPLLVALLCVRYLCVVVPLIEKKLRHSVVNIFNQSRARAQFVPTHTPYLS